MKKSIRFISLSLSIFMLSLNVYSQDEILGEWFAKDFNNSIIKIYQDGNLYYGKIIKSDISKYEGQIIIRKMHYFPKDKNWKGIIYSPKRDMEVDGTLSLESIDKIKVIGKKYFIKKTYYWVRN